MKNQTIKMITILSIFSILLLALSSIVKADSNKESIILKKAENEFIVYYEEICNNEFQFALYTNEKESADALVFINSIKDKEKDKALNVAYINSELYKQFFMNGEEKLSSAYIWIKDAEGKDIIQADKIDLTDIIDDEMIEFVDTTTKRITVDTTKTHQTRENVDGVETTVTVGKVVIKENANSEYYYKLIKADEENAKEKEFFELAETIQNGTDNTYTSLKLSKKFYELYKELEPKENEWLKVENYEILQPETAREGDKYIVWLKDINNEDEEIVDAKFLISIYEYKPEFVKEDKVETKVVKSPVTYDNPALIIIFAIVIVAIVVLVVLKVKTNQKGKHQ